MVLNYKYSILLLVVIIVLIVLLIINVQNKYILFEEDRDIYNKIIIETRIKNIPENIDKLAYLTDKFLVKKYISELNIPYLYIPKTYSYTNSCININWLSIPDRFVIKPTHYSGVAKICRNGTCVKTINLCNKYIKKTLNSSYNSIFKRFIHPFIPLVEHHYDYIRPGIIIEELIENNADWKFYVINGKVQFVIYVNGRENMNSYYVLIERDYTVDLNKVKFTYDLEQSKLPKKPQEWEQMINIAETIAKKTIGNELVRVDLYLSDNKIYFSELTFTPSGGRGRNIPPFIELSH